MDFITLGLVSSCLLVRPCVASLCCVHVLRPCVASLCCVPVKRGCTRTRACGCQAVCSPGPGTEVFFGFLVLPCAERLHLHRGLRLAEDMLPLARNFSTLELETGFLEDAPEDAQSSIQGVHGGATLGPPKVILTYYCSSLPAVVLVFQNSVLLLTVP